MTRNGVQLFVPRPGARKPSLALINRLRDDESAIPKRGKSKPRRGKVVISRVVP